MAKKTEPVELGAMIRAKREAMGMTLTQLAGTCRTSASHMSSIERGMVAHPQPATIEKIAAVLGIKLLSYRDQFKMAK